MHRFSSFRVLLTLSHLIGIVSPLVTELLGISKVSKWAREIFEKEFDF